MNSSAATSVPFAMRFSSSWGSPTCGTLSTTEEMTAPVYYSPNIFNNTPIPSPGTNVQFNFCITSPVMHQPGHAWSFRQVWSYGDGGNDCHGATFSRAALSTGPLVCNKNPADGYGGIGTLPGGWWLFQPTASAYGGDSAIVFTPPVDSPRRLFVEVKTKSLAWGPAFQTTCRRLRWRSCPLQPKCSPK